MRFKILASAVADLHSARLFYEQQGAGLGVYFFSRQAAQELTTPISDCEPSDAPA